jgi:hypothetical protein
MKSIKALFVTLFCTLFLTQSLGASLHTLEHTLQISSSPDSSRLDSDIVLLDSNPDLESCDLCLSYLCGAHSEIIKSKDKIQFEPVIRIRSIVFESKNEPLCVLMPNVRGPPTSNSFV